MTNSELKNWEETRSKGKTKFILTHGIAFGVIMAVVNGIMTYFIDRENPDKWNYIFYMALSWIPFGFLYSVWNCWFMEKRYKKSKK